MTSFAGILIHTILSRFIIHHHLKDKNVRSRNKSYNYLKCHLSINTRYDTIRIHVQTYLKVSGLLIYQIILFKKNNAICQIIIQLH